MATLLHRIGLASVRHRVDTVLVWLLVLLAGGAGALTLSGATVNTFSIPGQESTRALDLLADRFGSGAAGANAQVVLRAPGGQRITDSDDAAEVALVVQRLRALPGVVSASDPLDPAAPVVSADQRAAYSTVTYAAQAPDITDAQREALLDVVRDARRAGLTAEVTGQATESTETGGGTAGELAGVVVALVVLAVTYGTLVAAGMNLLTAIVGVGIGATGITTATGFVELSSTTPALALMLGLAVGIDYALFIVSRYRQELLAGRNVVEAAALATGTAGSAVLAAGTTVVIALTGLSVVGIPFLTQMGLAAAATVVVAVLVAITLVPAVLALLGHRVLSRRQRRSLPGQGGGHTAGAHTAGAHAAGPRRHGVHSTRPTTRTGRRGYGPWAQGLVRWRWPVLVAATAALALVAVPVASLRTSLNLPAAEGTTQARATAILEDSFGPGSSGPLLVLVDGDGAAQRAATISAAAAELPDVVVATPPRPNADGTAALVTLVPRSGPDSRATVDLVHTLREGVTDDRAGQPRAYVTGSTAVSVDVSAKLAAALPVYLALVVGLALVLLVLVFRSILVPVVGVVGFLLTIGASLGATVAVFQWGWLEALVHPAATGPLVSLAPIIIVGILFGLAMDYQVFLVARIHEAHAHGAAPRAAIVAGFRSAAPVVLAAALIMFGVFAGFVPGGDQTIQSIGFALAAGVLADAVVVRMVIMPTALAIMGRAAWWFPRWLRWLPAFDIEGAGLRAPHGPVASEEPRAPLAPVL